MPLDKFRNFVEKKNGVILDARDVVLYRNGHVPGAISLPYERFNSCYAKLKSRLEADKIRPIVVYCNGSGCGSAEEEQKKLVELSYIQVAVFSGGWTAWQEARLPVEKSAGADEPLPPWKRHAPPTKAGAFEATAKPSISAKQSSILSRDVLPPVKSPDDKAVAQLVARMTELYATTDSQAGDRIEEDLKAMINDDNVAAIAHALPQKLLETYLGLMVQERWASLDRETAVRWMSGRENPTAFQIAAVLRNWVVENKATLHDYVNSLPAGEWKDNVLASTGKDAIANWDSEEAFSLAWGMNSGEKQTTLMGAAVLQWSCWDPKAALEQIEQLPDVALQEKLVPNVAIGYATSDPKPAADWLIKSLVPGESLNYGLSGVIQAWVRRHTAADAAEWVARLPDGEVRKHAVKELITTWNDNNPQSAKEWVKNLPDGSLQAQAANELSLMLK